MKRHANRGAALTLLLLAALGLAPRHLAAQTSSQPTTLDKPAAGAPREIVLLNRGARDGVFTADNAWLLWWDGKTIGIWDLAREKVVGTIDDAAWSFVLSANGKMLATDMSWAADGRRALVIKVYDVATRKELHQFARPPGGAAKEPAFVACG